MGRGPEEGLEKREITMSKEQGSGKPDLFRRAALVVCTGIALGVLLFDITSRSVSVATAVLAVAVMGMCVFGVWKTYQSKD